MLCGWSFFFVCHSWIILFFITRLIWWVTRQAAPLRETREKHSVELPLSSSSGYYTTAVVSTFFCICTGVKVRLRGAQIYISGGSLSGSFD